MRPPTERLPYTTLADRDALAERFAVRWCPVCTRGRLTLNRSGWGWGANGLPVKCTTCKLEARLPWKALARSLGGRP